MNIRLTSRSLIFSSSNHNTIDLVSTHPKPLIKKLLNVNRMKKWSLRSLLFSRSVKPRQDQIYVTQSLRISKQQFVKLFLCQPNVWWNEKFSHPIKFQNGNERKPNMNRSTDKHMKNEIITCLLPFIVHERYKWILLLIPPSHHHKNNKNV